MKNIELQNQDCLQGMKNIPDGSIDVVCTDPPYLYLKNQKLEREFDEQLFFSECKRVLRKNGFIVLFGRGTSFYRWNTVLADLGFNFKEEIIWNKSHSTSPLMPVSRIHETVSVHCMGKAKINKTKVPYLEMKSHDIDSVITDIKRMRSVFTQAKSMKDVLDFLENNIRQFDSERVQKQNISVQPSFLKNENRCVAVARSMREGLNEKTIIRTDRAECKTFTKYGVNSDERKTGDRCVNVMQSVEFGLNEKTIIKQTRDHYSAIHPTQKPVRLLERLLALVIPQDKPKEEITVLDPFGGSFSTMEAVYNVGMKGISFEIDKEYFDAGKNRIDKLPPKQETLFD